MNEHFIIQNQPIPTIDIFALFWFLFTWLGYGIFTSGRKKRRRILFSLVNDHRLLWMRQLMKRDNRVLDMTAISNVMRNISFFASTSILLALGMASTLGVRDKIIETVSKLPFADAVPPFLWEIKIFLLVVVFIHTFFKFTWSLRLYNYVCVFVGAAPAHNEQLDTHELWIQRGWHLMNDAARHFNLGMRAYYYGVAALAWFINGWCFFIATSLVVAVLYRREFHSSVYYILSNPLHDYDGAQND